MKTSSLNKKIITSLLLLCISACANIPNHLIVAPDISDTTNVRYVNKNAQLTVTDMRTANHIVQILREGEASTLISAQESLNNTIKVALQEHWQKQGLTLQDIGNNKITVTIDKAVISVAQETMSYKVQTEIVLIVNINNGSETLTSTFNNRGNSEGPLQADIAVLERNFNQRLATLLQQILANEKISNFLK